MGKEWMKGWSMRVLMMDGRIHKVENFNPGSFSYRGVYFPKNRPPLLLKITFPTDVRYVCAYFF